ncbi:hypothetical protein LAUMK35_04976 [Mycobacterium pseudokansasii]|nr:hypothetical protein LAUMK35_04976 [Mycobacterium pseudokansasii]
MIGAVGEFGEVAFAGVALGDCAGHFVSDLAVLPGQFRLVEAFPGRAGDSGNLGDTADLGDAGGHFVEVGESFAGAHVGGVFDDEELGDDDVFAEVSVQQLVALVACGAGWLTFAVVVADFDGCCDRGQCEQDDEADDQQRHGATNHGHGHRVPVAAGAIGFGFPDAAFGGDRQYWREQGDGGQETEQDGDGARRAEGGEDAESGKDHGQEGEGNGRGGGEDDASDAGGGVDDGLVGGYLRAALFVVAADQEDGVVGASAEQDRGHECHGEL